MNNVYGAAVAAALVLSGCAAAPPASNVPPKEVQVNFNFTTTESKSPKKIARGAMSGVAQHVGFFYSVNPDCSSDGLVRTQLKTTPAHGTVAFAIADGYSNFSKSSASYECNSKKSPGVEVVYTSMPGYAGIDQFTVQGVGPHGAYLETDYTVTVIAPAS